MARGNNGQRNRTSYEAIRTGQKNLHVFLFRSDGTAGSGSNTRR